MVTPEDEASSKDSDQEDPGIFRIEEALLKKLM